MDTIDFFDRAGSAVCYAVDGEAIYLWNGSPVGYLSDERAYSYDGRLLGWFTNGWLYDRQNRPALFSEDASGGPVRPVRKVRPVRAVRRVRPVRRVRQVAHVRPVRSLNWSNCADATYFDQ